MHDDPFARTVATIPGDSSGSGFLRYLREQAALSPEQRDPLPADETDEERAASAADLERRIDADIAATKETS
jgi:hypothetical protein